MARFDREEASRKEIQNWYELWMDHFKEVNHEDPEPGRDYTVNRAIALKRTQDGHAFAAWDSKDNMIGYSMTHVSKMGYRKNAATFGITVLRSHRRSGVATSMLRPFRQI
ncbi:MAG: GNAT family N-acetyltransferase [Candidatus Aegiribacteria sp.]|nr:GNAT family N-acetyltransferase [Candidatus Aegiribacteria sp.]MBD3294423.1 GNAT family N-acetyltransferase [Candidatus Fermentibacteria bacterium]